MFGSGDKGGSRSREITCVKVDHASCVSYGHKGTPGHGGKQRSSQINILFRTADHKAGKRPGMANFWAGINGKGAGAVHTPPQRSKNTTERWKTAQQRDKAGKITTPSSLYSSRRTSRRHLESRTRQQALVSTEEEETHCLLTHHTQIVMFARVSLKYNMYSINQGTATNFSSTSYTISLDYHTGGSRTAVSIEFRASAVSLLDDVLLL